MGNDSRFPSEHSPDTTRWTASFESAWDSAGWEGGDPPDIVSFLRNVEPSLSTQVLFEFVQLDLTRRWQLAADRVSNGASGAAARDIPRLIPLDEYVTRFPALAAEDRRLLELILHEYRLRKVHGAVPDLQAYVRHYGRRFEELAELLRAIDHQLDDETVDVSVEQPLEEPAGVGSSSRHGDTSPDDTGNTVAISRHDQAGQVCDEKQVGNYVLLEEIARGGMGVVFRARQRTLNRLVAVKMILAGEMASSRDVNRFYTEAEAAARLKHPGIIAIHEIGEHNGLPYFSMELAEGPSLDDMIRDQSITCRESAEHLLHVAEAIYYAHEHGVLHRDLKPSNVLLDQDGHPKVTDFGLAKRVEGGSDLTASGTILGTPGFMPPEQAMGKKGRIDKRSDIYSLGAILYALLTGRPPFRAETTSATLLQVIHNEPVAPRSLNPDIDRDLETICLKCMAKEPSYRYSTAKELAEELGRYLQGEPIRARPVGRIERGWRWCRRNPVWAGLCVAILLAVFSAAAAVVFVHRSNRLAQLASLQGSFENQLDRPAATVAYLESMEQQIDRMADFNSLVASELRPRLYETFSKCVHDLIRQPRLTEEDVANIESLLASLEDRSRFDVAPYRDELQRTMHQWRTLVQLASPFDELSETFAETDLVMLRDDSRALPRLVVPESARKRPGGAPRFPVRVTSRSSSPSTMTGHRANTWESSLTGTPRTRPAIWPTMNSFCGPQGPGTARRSRISPLSPSSTAGTPTL